MFCFIGLHVDHPKLSSPFAKNRAALYFGSESLLRLFVLLVLQISRLEAYLMTHHPCWIAMCHNDLQYGNIMALPAAAPPSPFAVGPQQQQEQQRSAAALAAGVMPIPIDILSQQLHALAVTSSAASAKTPLGISPASSGGSFVMLRGRRGSNVQLEDGSMAFPGVKARVRGQSPDAKRPGGGSPTSEWSFRGAASSVGATVASSSVCGDGEDSWLGDSDPDGEGEEGGQVAAAVECLQQEEKEQKASRLRHVSSGPALAMFIPGQKAVNAASSSSGKGVKSAGVTFAVGPSLAVEGGGDGLLSSDDSDDLLPAAPGTTADDDAAGGWRVKEMAASKSRSGQKYCALRKSKRTPAPGIEFPACGANTDSEEFLTEEGLEEEESSGFGDDGPGGVSEEGPVAPAPSFASTIHTSFRSAHSPTSSAAALARSTGSFSSASAVGSAAAVAAAGGGGDGGAVEAPDRDGAVTSPLAQQAAADSIRLIDYEYSGFNPVVLDIANHWCEWAANYHTEQAHVLEFSKLPNELEQEHFVRCYLAALMTAVGVKLPASAVALDLPEQQPSPSAAVAADEGTADLVNGGVGASVGSVYHSTSPWRSLPFWLQQFSQETKTGTAAAATADDTKQGTAVAAGCVALNDEAWEQLVQSVVSGSRAYLCVSHLLWALWGYIQAQVSDVDFDFMSYGQQRWEQYMLTRPQAVAAAGGPGGKAGKQLQQ